MREWLALIPLFGGCVLAYAIWGVIGGAGYWFGVGGLMLSIGIQTGHLQRWLRGRLVFWGLSDPQE